LRARANFDASAAFAAASISTSTSGARLWEKAEDLNEALLELQAMEWACREADKEAVNAYEAHHLILSQIRQLAEWTASLWVRKLRLKLHPGHVGPGGGVGLRYNLLRADEQPGRSCWRWSQAHVLKPFASYSRRWSAQGGGPPRR
jgi:hypothetical protein